MNPSTVPTAASCLLVALLAWAPKPAAAQTVDTGALSPDDLVARALSDDPELRAIRARWRAALRTADAMGEMRPQPVLRYSTSLPAGPSPEPLPRHEVGISQMFPRARVLADAGDPMREEAAMLASRFEARALRLAFDIRTVAVEVARIDAMAGLMRRQRDIYLDVLAHDEAVLAYGAVDQGDLLRTTLMIEVMNDRLADLDAEREEAIASLRAMARLPFDEPFAFAPPALPAGAGELPDLESIVAEVVRRNPEFGMLAAEGRMQSEQAEVERNGVVPMPEAMLGWSTMPGFGREGRDMLMVGVAVPLPVFRRQYDLAASARTIAAEASADEADALAWDLREEVAHALLRIREEQARIDRFDRDILPTAGDTTEHYAIRLARGDAQHTEYLLAFEQELDLRVAVVDARAAIAVELARLDMLTAGWVTGDSAPAPPSIDTMSSEPTSAGPARAGSAGGAR